MSSRYCSRTRLKSSASGCAWSSRSYWTKDRRARRLRQAFVCARRGRTTPKLSSSSISQFPAPSATAETAASDIRSDPFWVLEDESSATAIGFLHLHTRLAPTGYISDIALHPKYQRRGLGETLMRWALAWFREQGMRRAALTTNTDNPRAIALYTKLGFVVIETGIDYRRSLDEDEVRRVLEKHDPFSRDENRAVIDLKNTDWLGKRGRCCAEITLVLEFRGTSTLQSHVFTRYR